MLLKTIKGMYQLQYNYSDAFNLEDFTSKYIEEFMDSYPFIVGDISSGILRLKGFNNDPQSEAYYKKINKYLEVSCAFGCPFFILKRMKNEEEYEHLPIAEKNVLTEPLFVIPSIAKVNYDKESLVLESSRKARPRILLDMSRLTSVPRDEPFSDVLEFIKQDKASSNNSRDKKPKPVQENVTSYVSASPDFDPSKKAKFNKPNNQMKSKDGKPNKEKNQQKKRDQQRNNNQANLAKNKEVRQNKENYNKNNLANKPNKDNTMPKNNETVGVDNNQNKGKDNNSNQKRNFYKQRYNKGPKPNKEVRKDQNNG